MSMRILVALLLTVSLSLVPGLLAAQELSGGEAMPPREGSIGTSSATPGPGNVPAPAEVPAGGPAPAPAPAPTSAPAPSPAAPSPGPVPGVPVGPADPPPSPLPASSPAEIPDMDPTTLGVVVLAMLIGGLVLLFIEVALIPGFGLTGVTGIVIILAGLGLSFWKLDTRVAVIYTLVSFVALVALVLWAVYVFPYTSLGKRFRLETKISVEDGYTAIRDMSAYVGREGVATSDLRPSGIARIGDERLDVISDGEFGPRGTRIRVVKVKSGSVIVTPLEPPAA